jgi:competence protein ComEC
VNSKVRERAPRLAGRSGAAALAALAIAHLFLLPLPSRTLHLLALLLGIGLLLLFVLLPRTNLQRLRAATLGALLIALRIALFGLPIPPVDVAALPAGVAAAEGEVRALLAPLRGAQRIVLDVSGVRVSVEAPPNPTLRVGDRVSATLEYTSQSPEVRERARVRGIQAAARTYSVTLLSRGGPLEWLRTRIGDDLERVIPAPAGGFAAAIVVGLRERVDERLADAFTATGLGHVVALSGWNVAITMAVADRALRRLPTRRRRWSLILIALLYGLFAGASASVIRASVMSAAALVAAAGGRRGAGAVALAHAALALLILDPSIAYDAGFRLSALATAGLLAKSADWSKVAIHVTPHFPRLLQRPWSAIAEDVAVSIAAQAATIGVVIALFGRVALWSVPLTLLIAPLIPAATGAALLAIIAGEVAPYLTGPLSLIPSILALPASALFRTAAWIAEAGAQLPLTDLVVPRDATFAVGAALSLIGIAALNRRAAPSTEQSAEPKPGISGRVSAAGGVVILIVSSLLSSSSGVAPGSLRISVLDVGQGDAILVELQGRRMLIDGGPDPARLSVELDALIPSWDRKIDVLVASHPHEDHLAGLPRLLDRYQIRSILGAETRGGGPASASWRELLLNRQVTYHTVTTGTAFMLGSARLEVLWPDQAALKYEPADGGSALNNRSIVLRLDVSGFSALFTGDIESNVDALIARRLEGPVDMLKAPHHGSATASSRTLLNAADPRLSIISVGEKNSYGHPAPATIDRLGERGGAVLRTDLDGTVSVTVQSTGIKVRTDSRTPQVPTRAMIGVQRLWGLSQTQGADALWPPLQRLGADASAPAGCPLPAATIRAWPSQRILRYSSPGAMTSF